MRPTNQSLLLNFLFQQFTQGLVGENNLGRTVDNQQRGRYQPK